MKKIYLLLTLCLAMIACKRNNIDFSYSPTEPRAGQSVQFSNLSDSGEEWSWTFGDGATSTIKSPSHTYKKPGTYRVILKVDNKSSWTEVKELTVYDTVPTFVCADTVFSIYTDYKFTANVYNPYNYTIEYEWTLTDSVVSLNGDVLTCYFTQPDDSAEISLRIIINGDTTNVTKRFYIEDKETNSVLLRTDEGDYRQRIFGKRAEEAKRDESAAPLLDIEQDTTQTYNGYEFNLSELKAVFPELEGFHIANRKIYYRESGNGLWVANIDGANQVQIDDLECTAMTLDRTDNRIYWANENGVWYMPFIGSDNNKFVTVPAQLNELTNVTKIAADSEKR